MLAFTGSTDVKPMTQVYKLNQELEVSIQVKQIHSVICTALDTILHFQTTPHGQISLETV